MIDRPDVDVSKRLGGFDLSDWNIPSWDAKTDNGNNGSNTDKDKKSPPGGGNYRVLLLDSPQVCVAECMWDAGCGSELATRVWPCEGAPSRLRQGLCTDRTPLTCTGLPSTCVVLLAWHPLHTSQ